MEICVLLHNIRSTHNVGSIFRTADAAGVLRIYLSGYTPLPKDRFGREQKDITKTALGAEKFIPWEHAASVPRLFAKLKKEGWSIAGIEQDKRAHDYRSFKYNDKTLFVFGNEVRGLSKEIRRRCHALVEIPMHGRKESLNVSVAAGVILFAAR